MNTHLSPPPDRDLSPATRNRHRDELIAIVDHESARTGPRRRFVPLAAAAAVVAVTAGLAVGVPALRSHTAQSPAAGPGASLAEPATAPLTAAETSRYLKACHYDNKSLPKEARHTYTVIDAFKWVDPPAGTHVVAWVLFKYAGTGRYFACGVGAKGNQTGLVWAASGETKMAAIEQGAAGAGTYAKSVTRVTVAFKTEPPTEAILRHGFFFAPMKWEDTRVQPKPDAAPQYTIRAYGADGQVVYASAPTYREEQTQLDACYTNPEGTKVVLVFGGRKGTPPISQCKRGVAWNW